MKTIPPRDHDREQDIERRLLAVARDPSMRSPRLALTLDDTPALIAMAAASPQHGGDLAALEGRVRAAMRAAGHSSKAVSRFTMNDFRSMAARLKREARERASLRRLYERAA